MPARDVASQRAAAAARRHGSRKWKRASQKRQGEDSGSCPSIAGRCTTAQPTALRHAAVREDEPPHILKCQGKIYAPRRAQRQVRAVIHVSPPSHYDAYVLLRRFLLFLFFCVRFRCASHTILPTFACCMPHVVTPRAMFVYAYAMRTHTERFIQSVPICYVKEYRTPAYVARS